MLTTEQRLENLEQDFETMRRAMLSFLDRVEEGFGNATQQAEVERSLALLRIAEEARFATRLLKEAAIERPGTENA